QAKPAHDELIYAHHDRGFALFSMRSPAVTRLYLQVPPEEQADAWSDARVWDELRLRFEGGDGWAPTEGPVLEKGVTGMRSYVAASRAAAASLAENYVGFGLDRENRV